MTNIKNKMIKIGPKCWQKHNLTKLGLRTEDSLEIKIVHVYVNVKIEFCQGVVEHMNILRIVLYQDPLS